jgi:hypothetical protein
LLPASQTHTQTCPLPGDVRRPHAPHQKIRNIRPAADIRRGIGNQYGIPPRAGPFTGDHIGSPSGAGQQNPAGQQYFSNDWKIETPGFQRWKNHTFIANILSVA